MRALVLDRPGAPESLRLAEVPEPAPGPGQVAVRVEAVGLNPVDYKVIASGHPDWIYPHIPGLDVAGTIEAVGSGGEPWVPGQRVYFHGDLRRPGGFAEVALADATTLAALPDEVAATDAAALPTAGFTAYQALFHRVRPWAGQSILVHGGSGGVGGFALQLARELRLRVLATASPANLNLVQELGADEAIDYTGGEAAIAEAVRHATRGLGVDVVLDAAGPPRATEAFDLLAFGGALVCVAGLPDFSKWKPFHKACSVHEISLGAAYGPGGSPVARAELGRLGASLIGRLAAGKIASLVTEAVPFEEIPQALGRLRRREVTGKIVARGPGF